MRRKPGTDASAIAVDQIEDAGRQAGRVDDVGEDRRRQRREFRWLEHDGAAGEKSGDHLERDLADRPVPRRDQCRHPDRLPGQAVTRRMVAQRPDEVEAAHRIEEVGHVARTGGGLRLAGEVDRRAHLARNGARHLVGAVEMDLAHLFDEGHPRRWIGRRPCREGSPRRRDRGLRVALISQSDRAVGLLGRGVDKRVARRRLRCPPLAVDVEAVEFDHGSLLRSAVSGCLRESFRPPSSRSSSWRRWYCRR